MPNFAFLDKACAPEVIGFTGHVNSIENKYKEAKTIYTVIYGIAMIFSYMQSILFFLIH